MRRPFQFIVPIAALMILAAAPAFTMAAVGTDQAVIAELLAKRTNLNASIYVSRGSDVLFDGSVGWRKADARLPVDRNTLFNIASVTKAFTATAILKLAQKGKLSLDDRIDRFFPGDPADKSVITIGQLLSHTSGLAHGYEAGGKMTRDDAVTAVLAKPLEQSPGEAFTYTDDGYALLAAIIEIASGTSYSEFVRQEIFEPAGMRAKFWDEIDPNADTGAAEIVSDNRPATANLDWGYIGSGGIWSSTDDLVRFFDALETGKILDSKWLGQLFEPRVKVSVGHAAYGWFTGTSDLGHPFLAARGNEDWGHSAAIYWFPEQALLVVVATNSGFEDDNAVSKVLVNEIEAKLIPPAPNLGS